MTNEDLRVPLKFYKDARVEGNFDAGIEMALRAILTSPEFLFRVERDPVESGTRPIKYRISDVELASRLPSSCGTAFPMTTCSALRCRESFTSRGSGATDKAA